MSYKDYQIDGIPYELKLGIDLPVCPANLKTTCQELNRSYGFALVDLFHKNNFRDENTMKTRQIALTRPDTVMNLGYWQSFVLAKIFDPSIICDSPI